MQELARRVRDLIAASDHYRQAMAEALGVGVPEAVTLGHLYHAGQLTPTAIAERLGMTTASVTGLLDRLGASGFLVRRPNPRDRRSVLVTLTEQGHRSMRTSSDLFAADIELAMAEAEPAERAGLELLLQRAATALQHRAADPDQLAELFAAGRAGAPDGNAPEPRDPGEISPS